MIDLIFHSENAFIYDIKDWETLRKEYRCVGELLGHTQRQPVFPLQLQPEEALLLIEKQIARLITYKEKQATKEEQKEFKSALFEVEKVCYKELRMKQLLQYADKIVAGKRKWGDTRSEKEIIDGELDKLVINEKRMVWPVMMHTFEKDSASLVDKAVLLKQTTTIKFETFKSLWEQKFYITSGCKFGGDYLAYPGDPLLYHSHYIVRCLNENEKVYPTELVVLGRVATSVKKKGVLSYIQNGKVNYITIKWMGK